MIPNVLAIASLLIILAVSLALLIPLSDGFRRHRIGVTASACWAIIALVFFVLKAIGDPLPKWLYSSWLWPVGLMCISWALWDVSRLVRTYGTCALTFAAEIARDVLHPHRQHSNMKARSK